MKRGLIRIFFVHYIIADLGSHSHRRKTTDCGEGRAFRKEAQMQSVVVDIDVAERE